MLSTGKPGLELLRDLLLSYLIVYATAMAAQHRAEQKDRGQEGLESYASTVKGKRLYAALVPSLLGVCFVCLP